METISGALRRGCYRGIAPGPKTTSYEAEIMLIRQFPAVMVVDGVDKIVGIISGADLIEHKRKYYP